MVRLACGEDRYGHFDLADPPRGRLHEADFERCRRDSAFNGRQCAAAVGSIIGRMAAPGSERATYRWLQQRSALGELLEVDFESMGMMQLYRVSDLLDAARKAIENHLFNKVTDLFGLGVTVTLYDLSNTYFEGVAAAQPLAQHGHSKEKRSDCPLLTLGLVVDGSGFVRRSEVLAV